MSEKPFQEEYPENLSHCYGCGKLNTEGLQIKSYWDGEETVCSFRPKPSHIAVPGYVYGGLIASIIDCHATGTASAAATREQNDPNKEALRYVTASLHVDYLRPTPMGVDLNLRGTVKEIKGRKVVVGVTVEVDGKTCARGEVVAVQMPENMMSTP